MREPDEHVSPCCGKSRSSSKAKKALWKSRRVEIESLSDDASSSGWSGRLDWEVGYTRRRIHHHRFRHPHLDQSQRIWVESRGDGGGVS